MEIRDKKMMSATELAKMLYVEGYFSVWKTSQEVNDALRNKGFNLSLPLIIMSLNSAVKKGILSKKTENKRFKFSQREPPQIKIKDKEISDLNEVLSKITEKKLGERFQQDIRELNTAFTYDCGNSAGFLLRKILEKAIFFAFATNNKTDLIKDKDDCVLGLEAMINLAAREKIKGVPILLPKTAKDLVGIKLLGDAAVHDYLMDVEVSDINHYLAIWIVAIKELCVKF